DRQMCCEDRRNGVADLSERLIERPLEGVVAGETLEAGRLPDREAPVLFRVHVAAACGIAAVGCDRDGRPVPRESPVDVLIAGLALPFGERLKARRPGAGRSTAAVQRDRPDRLDR